jgi:hypothetical protein
MDAAANVRRSPHRFIGRCLPFVVACTITGILACQMGAQATKSIPRSASTATTRVPTLIDITASTGIHFEHLSSPEQKYIVESMSGGVALLDYDGDGWLRVDGVGG